MTATSVSGSAEPQAGKGTETVAMELGQPFNPFHLFQGIFVPDALVRYRGLNPTAKFLWARLARYAGKNGRVYPSVPTLAAELGLSVRQVQRGLTALEREGFIRRDLRKTAKGDYTSTEYVFLWHKIFADACALLARKKLAAKKGVVTDMSPGGERNVTTKIKRRLEEKTSSSPLATPPPSPTPSPNSNRRDDDDDDKPVAAKAELFDLIRQSTGQAPDRRLFRDITEGLELRQIPLREYLDDIRPRLDRLKQRPRPGFFLHHVTTWRDAQPAEKPAMPANPTHSRCPSCSGVGRTTEGYCNCVLGKDLEKVESRAAMKRAQSEVGA